MVRVRVTAKVNPSPTTIRREGGNVLGLGEGGIEKINFD
jgi:hypothetical protein